MGSGRPRRGVCGGKVASLSGLAVPRGSPGAARPYLLGVREKRGPWSRDRGAKHAPLPLFAFNGENWAETH